MVTNQNQLISQSQHLFLKTHGFYRASLVSSIVTWYPLHDLETVSACYITNRSWSLSSFCKLSNLSDLVIFFRPVEIKVGFLPLFKIHAWTIDVKRTRMNAEAHTVLILWLEHSTPDFSLNESDDPEKDNSRYFIGLVFVATQRG